MPLLETSSQFFSKILPNATGDYVDIGTWSLILGCSSFHVSVVVADASFSASKQYFLTLSNSVGSSGVWTKAIPFSSTGSSGANDFELAVRRTTNDVSMRLWRTGGTATGVEAELWVRREGSGSDSFADSNSTGTETAPTDLFSNSLITQTGGKVGIGKAPSNEILEINGAIALGTSSGTDNGTLRWTGSDFEGRKAGAWVSLTSAGGGGTPGGSDGQVQYNNGGIFGGAAQVYYDDTNHRVGIGASAPRHRLEVIHPLASPTQFHVGVDTADSGGYIGSHGTANLYLIAGSYYSGSAWVAKTAYSSLLYFNNGTYSFYANDGLTPGASFTPTQRLIVYPDGGITFLNSSTAAIGTAGQSRLRSSGSGVLQVSNNGAAYVDIPTGTPVTPGGSDNQFQYNNGGVFGGSSGLTYDETNNRPVFSAAQFGATFTANTNGTDPLTMKAYSNVEYVGYRFQIDYNSASAERTPLQVQHTTSAVALASGFKTTLQMRAGWNGGDSNSGAITTEYLGTAGSYAMSLIVTRPGNNYERLRIDDNYYFYTSDANYVNFYPWYQNAASLPLRIHYSSNTDDDRSPLVLHRSRSNALTANTAGSLSFRAGWNPGTPTEAEVGRLSYDTDDTTGADWSAVIYARRNSSLNGRIYISDYYIFRTEAATGKISIFGFDDSWSPVPFEMLYDYNVSGERIPLALANRYSGTQAGRNTSHAVGLTLRSAWQTTPGSEDAAKFVAQFVDSSNFSLNFYVRRGGSMTKRMTIENGVTMTGVATGSGPTATAGQGTYFYDTTLNRWQMSENGGAYTNVAGAAAGTTNRLAKYTAASRLGDSNVSDDGSTVTVTGALSVTTTLVVTTGLGGNLSVNGYSIVSTSNGNIPITPNGTGSIVLDGLNWPQVDGSNTQVLMTNGAAQLSWTTRLSDIVQDTTPQLGGNLDVNGYSIVSISNGNIPITPNGTGSIVLDGLNWPQSDGSDGQVLKTNGSGQLSWLTVTTGTITGSGNSGKIAKFTGSTAIGDSIITESSSKIGINQASPGGALHVVGGITPASDTAQLRLESSSDTSNYWDIFANASSGGGTDYGLQFTKNESSIFLELGAISGSEPGNRFSLPGAGSDPDLAHRFYDAGIVVNTTTGGTAGNMGSGTINVATDIYKNGTVYNDPDYVFEHFYTGRIDRFKKSTGASRYKGLRSIEEVRSFVNKNYHLPNIHRNSMGIFERGDKILEVVEELYLYLFKYQDEIKALKNEIETLKKAA